MDYSTLRNQILQAIQSYDQTIPLEEFTDNILEMCKEFPVPPMKPDMYCYECVIKMKNGEYNDIPDYGFTTSILRLIFDLYGIPNLTKIKNFKWFHKTYARFILIVEPKDAELDYGDKVEVINQRNRLAFVTDYKYSTPGPRQFIKVGYYNSDETEWHHVSNLRKVTE